MDSRIGIGCSGLIAALMFSGMLAVTIACGPPEISLNGDNGRDNGNDEVSIIEERPASAFFADTDLVTLLRPYRCLHERGSLEDLRFRWKPSGQARVVAAVMVNEPRAENRKIHNVDDIVWIWSTAGDRSDSGWVSWYEGFAPNPETGLPDKDRPIPSIDDISAALISDGIHLLWFVTWAWDDERNLSHSSEVRPFFYSAGSIDEASSITSDPACNLRGVGSLDSASNQNDADDRWYCYWCRPLVRPELEMPEHQTSFGCVARVVGCR